MSGVFDPTESRRLTWNLIGRLVNTPSPSLSLSLSSPPDLLHQINAPDWRRPLLCRTQTLRSLCFLFLFGLLGGFFTFFCQKPTGVLVILVDEKPLVYFGGALLEGMVKVKWRWSGCEQVLRQWSGLKFCSNQHCCSCRLGGGLSFLHLLPSWNTFQSIKMQIGPLIEHRRGCCVCEGK